MHGIDILIFQAAMGDREDQHRELEMTHVNDLRLVFEQDVKVNSLLHGESRHVCEQTNGYTTLWRTLLRACH